MESQLQSHSTGAMARDPTITRSDLSQAQPLLLVDSFGGPHGESSPMDIDPVADDVGPPNAVTVNKTSSSTWHNLTAQALSTQNRSPQASRTQDEQRESIRQSRKGRQFNRQHRAAVISKTRPRRRQAATEACDRNGTGPRDTSEKLKKEMQEFQKGKLKRREMIHRKKRAALNKAEEVARTKALERALGGLNLDASEAQSDQEHSHPLPLLLSFDHVLRLLGDLNHAKKVFTDFQQHHRDPSYAEGLCLGDQRRLLSLLKSEYTLLSMTQETGSTEAALLYQDQRIAYMDELRSSVGNLPSMNEGLNDYLNNEHATNLCSSTLASKAGQSSEGFTDPVLPQSGPSISLTAKKKKMDVQTANDVAAYQENPSTVLSKKRQKRVQNALLHGRADLNAMQLEKQRANTQKVAKELKELTELTEKRDVYRPQYETKVQPSVEKRDLYQPQHETRVQVTMGKRDLYQPQQNNIRLQAPPQSREAYTTNIKDPVGGGTRKLHDSYRPARGVKPHKREFGSSGGEAQSPFRYGDFYRAYPNISNRNPRFSDDNPDSMRMYDSYRPSKRSKEPVSEASSSRSQSKKGATPTGLIDSYRPVDGNMTMQL
ncbi:MAG: hypothetical protein Q9188_006348 [Gyalolechia gomerana]